MPSTEKLRAKLIDKLKELFQLNQPDLDFGFYRIMHAKAEQITSFVEKDLLGVISDAFGQVDEDHKKQLKDAIDTEIQQAIEYGVADPENSPKVLEAKAKYESAKDTASAEAEIYDHLYRFFERYYDDGDFISRRYYTRETPGKAAPFAIPYNGEEVKLHWANADQYYIKSTEYFSNYRFNLSLGIKKLLSIDETDILQRALQEDANIPANLNVTFRIVDATEGDHGNIKSSDENKRFFIIHKPQPVELTDTGELFINFEYRSDSEKTSQENTWRDTRNTEAVQTIFAALRDIPEAEDFLRGFQHIVPTEKKKDRTLLEKYIYQYTARNTMDYFIHKDLGAFLKRELDFFIKNEVMRLDDIVNADAPKVEDYLAKIKVLRKIATKLIEFLAQLEDFQKKLWLKKKFIVETNYCLTLDRIPEELYPEIIANQTQHEEWIKLFAIDEIEGDTTTTPAYSNPLSLDFLKANSHLVLDTCFFDEAFKAKLISSIQDFDEHCDGLLIHSENFQALNMLQERYINTIGCVYIDPPYNTGDDYFCYKDGYRDSSWMTLIYDRLLLSKKLIKRGRSFFSSIDNNEVSQLKLLMDIVFDDNNFVETFIWTRTNTPPALSYKSRKVAEYIHCYENQVGSNQYFDSYIDNLDAPLLNTGNPISSLVFPVGAIFFNISDNTYYSSPEKRIELVTPVMVIDGKNANEVELKGCFKWQQSFLEKEIKNGTKFIVKSEMFSIRFQRTESEVFKKPKNKIDIELDYTSGIGTNETANKELNEMGYPFFSYPKPTSLISKLVLFNSNSLDIMLDYFAGSGTTGHAVINLNREDDGSRKYILVEMGDYFDTVLKPRIQKVVYSKDWKEGKPQNRDTGISHCIKYLRLESYEDTLNNLVLKSDPTRDRALDASDSLKEDYMLHYLLDVESRGSQSLLNIDAFADPTRYLFKVKKPGSDEYVERAVDLIETFNYLIGLRLVHLAEPQTFAAGFRRLHEPDLPQDQDTRLVLDGDLKQAPGGKWWIRKVEGWVPKNPFNPNDGLKEKVLIVWRKLTGNFEEDNLVLDTWFQKNRISTYDWEFDTIYVNGSNNLPNLQQPGDTWKVRLIEEEFLKRMWDNQGV